VVEAPDHNSETALAQFLNHFVTVTDVIVITHVVFLLISIKAVVRALVQPAPLQTARQLRLLAPILVPLVGVKVVNCRVIVNLTLFILVQNRSQNPGRVLRRHREFILTVGQNGTRISIRQLAAQAGWALDHLGLTVGANRPRRLQSLASAGKIGLRKLNFGLH
jgi:hypothetical protein